MFLIYTEKYFTACSDDQRIRIPWGILPTQLLIIYTCYMSIFHKFKIYLLNQFKTMLMP